uniref:Uncharacterized protein n=1 Tax=Passalora fulva TaxID=5499 RepID=A0A9Q8LAZ5_PASFU
MATTETPVTTGALPQGTVVLKSHDQWDKFDRQLELYAESLNVWKYVDPHQLSNEPTEPTHLTFEEIQQAYTAGDATSRDLIKLRQTDADRRQRMYDIFAAARSKLITYLIRTTTELGQELMHGQNTLRAKYQALKDQYGPDDMLRFRRLAHAESMTGAQTG